MKKIIRFLINQLQKQKVDQKDAEEKSGQKDIYNGWWK